MKNKKEYNKKQKEIRVNDIKNMINNNFVIGNYIKSSLFDVSSIENCFHDSSDYFYDNIKIVTSTNYIEYFRESTDPYIHESLQGLYEKDKTFVDIRQIDEFILNTTYLESEFDYKDPKYLDKDGFYYDTESPFGTYLKTTFDYVEIELNMDSILSELYIFKYTEEIYKFIKRLEEKFPFIKKERYVYNFPNFIGITKEFLERISYYDKYKDKYVDYFKFSINTLDSNFNNIFNYVQEHLQTDQEESMRKAVSIMIAEEKFKLGYSSVDSYNDQLDCTTFRTQAWLENTENNYLDFNTVNSNSCGSSYCPICERNKAKKRASKATKILTENYKENYFFFLTLTQPNIHYKDFRISKILFQKTWKNFKDNYLSKNEFYNGYLNTYEVSFEENREDYIHPHSHIVLSYSRRNKKGHMTKSKDVLNVEEEIVKIRETWTKYFLSKLKKYHESKGNIYGIKEKYSEDFMRTIDNTSYLDYKKNFSVDLKTISVEELDKVAFEISHYMFKPTNISKDKIIDTYKSLYDVYMYKLKMYKQTYKMHFFSSGGLFSKYDLDGSNDTLYRVQAFTNSVFNVETNSYDMKSYNISHMNLVATISELQNKKLFNNRIEEYNREYESVIENEKIQNKKNKEALKKLEEKSLNLFTKKEEIKRQKTEIDVNKKDKENKDRSDYWKSFKNKTKEKFNK